MIFQSLTPIQKNDQAEPSSAAKWAVACAGVTFATTAVVVLIHVIPTMSVLIVGTKIEGIVSLVMVSFWAATVSIVTNASNGLGLEGGAITEGNLNGNLYYFSWAGFVTSVILFVSYLREVFGVDLVGSVRNRSARLSLWAGFMASALIMTGSAARVLNDDCKPNVDFTGGYCRRTTMAVAIGSAGVVLSFVVIAFKFLTHSAPFYFEFVSSILLALSNAFCVAYVTSAKGPGSSIGNLYYSSWTTFLCSALLAADCYNQFTSGDSSSASTNYGDEKANDVPVEDLPPEDENI